MRRSQHLDSILSYATPDIITWGRVTHPQVRKRHRSTDINTASSPDTLKGKSWGSQPEKEWNEIMTQIQRASLWSRHAWWESFFSFSLFFNKKGRRKKKERKGRDLDVLGQWANLSVLLETKVQSVYNYRIFCCLFLSWFVVICCHAFLSCVVCILKELLEFFFFFSFTVWSVWAETAAALLGGGHTLCCNSFTLVSRQWLLFKPPNKPNSSV